MLSIMFLTPVQQAHTLEAHVAKACNMSKFPAGDPEAHCYDFFPTPVEHTFFIL